MLFGFWDLVDIVYIVGIIEGCFKGVMVEYDDYFLGIDLDEVVGNEFMLSFLGFFLVGIFLS